MKLYLEIGIDAVVVLLRDNLDVKKLLQCKGPVDVTPIYSEYNTGIIKFVATSDEVPGDK